MTTLSLVRTPKLRSWKVLLDHIKIDLGDMEIEVSVLSFDG